MQWQGRRESGNVEDRRGMGRGPMLVGGGGLATLVLVVVAMLAGVDPRQLLQSAPSADTSAPQPGGAPPADDPQAKFVSVILADTEDAWSQILPKLGKQYEDPHLVLFDGQVDSACGMASSAVGPFYCSRDAKVYLDTSFFRDLEQ